VSMMSTTGHPSVGGRSQEAAEVLARRMSASTADYVDAWLAQYRVISSPAYQRSERQVRAFAARDLARSFRPGSLTRQVAAVAAAGDRTPALEGIAAPVLVVHGDADVMVDVSGGMATAAAIPGAELDLVPGMGHDLPFEVWPRLIEGIERVVRRRERC
jgi:pimeloyl-ACP methyl ester carboxylesterase